MAREAKSGKKGSEECLSVACKGKSGRFHGSCPGREEVRSGSPGGVGGIRGS